MKISSYCCHKVSNRETKEIEADIYAENSFWGWLSPRRLSRKDWKFIGEEMGWDKE